jgi:hypothetical protein
MVALLCFFLALLASPFKPKSRLEAENTLAAQVTADDAKPMGSTTLVALKESVQSLFWTGLRTSLHGFADGSSSSISSPLSAKLVAWKWQALASVILASLPISP